MVRIELLTASVLVGVLCACNSGKPQPQELSSQTSTTTAVDPGTVIPEGIIYQSPDSSDLLYLPCAVHDRGIAWFYFFSYNADKTPPARLWELAYGEGAPVQIDSFDTAPFLAFEDGEPKVNEWPSSYLISDAMLYYTEAGVSEAIPFAYPVGSRTAPMSMKPSGDACADYNWSPCTLWSDDGRYLAVNNGDSLMILNGTESLKERLAQTDMGISQLFSADNGDFRVGANAGGLSARDFRVGNFSWTSDSRALYFDNHSVLEACIWRLDMQTRSVTKVVPYHAAFFPYCFTAGANGYVAYTQKNSIRVISSGASTGTGDAATFRMRDFGRGWYVVYDTTMADTVTLESVLGQAALSALSPFGPGLTSRPNLSGENLPASRYVSLRIASDVSAELSRIAQLLGIADSIPAHGEHRDFKWVCDVTRMPVSQHQADSMKQVFAAICGEAAYVDVTDESKLVLLGTDMAIESARNCQRVADSLGIPSHTLRLEFVPYD